MNAASTIFATRGFDGATTRAIADAAGCSEALIQRYFGGKEGLLVAVLKSERPDEDDAPFYARELCADMTIEAREMLAHAVAELGRMSERMRVVLSRAMTDAAFNVDFNRLSARKSVCRNMELRLERYRNAGRLAPDADCATAAEMLMSLGFQLGFVHREILGTSEVEIDRLVDGFARLYGQAMAQKGGA